MSVYFSAHGGRKVPKERHARKGPTVPSFRIYPPAVRALFRFAECLCAVRSRFAMKPRCCRSGNHLSVPCLPLRDGAWSDGGTPVAQNRPKPHPA